MKITVGTTVRAPLAEVWRAYTTPADILQWNAASTDWHTTKAAVDLREGGAFSSRMEAKDGSIGFDFAGTYTKVVPHKRIEYAFGDRTAQVSFAEGPQGVKVSISFDGEATHSVEQQRTGWQAILDNFARHIEAGPSTPVGASTISTPQIVDTKAEPAAVIHIVTARSDMPKVFGPAVGELMATLAAQGVTPVGAVFAHHLKMSRDAFDFELGVRVAAPVKPAGRVKPGELPAAKVARTIYSGAYEGLPAAWGQFNDWLAWSGHEQGPTLWEVYSIGPHSTPDPAQWRTELNRPLKS